MPRFFFVQTSEGYVDPMVLHLPEPANAEPESFSGETELLRLRRYQRRFEVKDWAGCTKALVTLRSPLEQASR